MNQDKIINVSLIVIAIIVISKILKLFKAPNESSEELEVEDEICTYPANWYVVNADAIEKAGFDFGTDEETIFRIFEKLKKDCDFENLFNAYGKRFYTGGFAPWLKYNLIEFLDAELSNTDREKLNEIMKNNGLTYSI